MNHLILASIAFLAAGVCASGLATGVTKYSRWLRWLLALNVIQGVVNIILWAVA